MRCKIALGDYNFANGVRLSKSIWEQVSWVSDSEMVCNALSRGTGGMLDVRVAIETDLIFSSGNRFPS
jgi:hypothetical protein